MRTGRCAVAHRGDIWVTRKRGASYKLNLCNYGSNYVGIRAITCAPTAQTARTLVPSLWLLPSLLMNDSVRLLLSSNDSGCRIAERREPLSLLWCLVRSISALGSIQMVDQGLGTLILLHFKLEYSSLQMAHCNLNLCWWESFLLFSDLVFLLEKVPGICLDKRSYM